MERQYTETDLKKRVAEAVALAVAPMQQRIVELEKRVMELEAENARLKKNSSNSSKPPSSDIVKPPKEPPKGGGKRKIGGQPGHAKHERTPFTPEQIDQHLDFELPAAEVAARKLIPRGWHVVQQVELVERPFVVTEYRAREYYDPASGQAVMTPLPAGVRAAGLLGTRMSALVAYLKGGCRMSYGLISTFFEDVLNLPISAGQLAKVVQKASAALEPAYAQLLNALPKQDYLGVDETGHKDRGKPMWTWCFRAIEFVVFRVLDSRATKVLEETLGKDYGGVIGCDYFSAYRKFLDESRCRMQFCHAHLIRDVKFLTTLPDKITQRWGHKLLKAIKRLFHTIHRRAKMTADHWGKALCRARDQILTIARRPPDRIEARTLGDRFRKHGREYFMFIEHGGVEPTNNRTEQTIRFIVEDRRCTQGTRGARGQRWCERVWSILGTCRLQGRSAFQFLVETLHNHFLRFPTPTLLPAGP